MAILWTKQETDMLEQLVHAGKSVDDCAKVFKSRTIHSIKNKCQSMGLRFEEFNPDCDFAAFEKLMKGAKTKCL